MDSGAKGTIRWQYLGAVRYRDGLSLQKERRERLRREGPGAGGYLLLLEHEPVITDGRFGRGGNIILSEDELGKRGVETYKTERGGDVTFHGPGQLVAYPIIDLRSFGLGAKAYVRALEETIIRVLGDYDIKGVTMDGYPGVWAYGGKIASIGVSVSGGITMHGSAFNVNTDLSYFLDDRPMRPRGGDDYVVKGHSRRGDRLRSRHALLRTLLRRGLQRGDEGDTLKIQYFVIARFRRNRGNLIFLSFPSDFIGNPSFNP